MLFSAIPKIIVNVYIYIYIFLKVIQSIVIIICIIYLYIVPDIGLVVRVFANSLGELGSIPDRVIPKT